MKRIIAFTAALVLAASLLGLSACRHDGGKEDAKTSDAPVTTQTADGQSTESPEDTSYPATDAPDATQSPDGQTTPDPEATPGTEPGTDPTGEPGPSGIPEKTMPPELTSPRPSAPSTPAPTSAPAPTSPGETTSPTAAPTPALPTPAAPNSFSVTYTGETVDCASLKVGDSFFWTLILSSKSSSLVSGRWLVDYDERFLEPVAFSTTWEGSLIAQIDETWDNEEASSDKPDFFVNPAYEGATGANPYGEAGNWYSVVGMYLTTMSYGGVQASGPMVRLEFRVKALPKTGDMQHDARGYYLPVGIVVIESKALNGSTPVTHGSITAEPGRMYFKH